MGWIGRLSRSCMLSCEPMIDVSTCVLLQSSQLNARAELLQLAHTRERKEPFDLAHARDSLRLRLHKADSHAGKIQSVSLIYVTLSRNQRPNVPLYVLDQAVAASRT